MRITSVATYILYLSMDYEVVVACSQKEQKMPEALLCE